MLQLFQYMIFFDFFLVLPWGLQIQHLNWIEDNQLWAFVDHINLILFFGKNAEFIVDCMSFVPEHCYLFLQLLNFLY